MDEFIDDMRLLLSVMGHKVLEPVSESKNGTNATIFYLKDKTGIRASGKLVSDGFAVLRDSTISATVATSVSQFVLQKRQRLMDQGIVKNNIFIQDWTFTSPSLAAAIVVGYSINGRTAWKTKKGMSIKELEEA